MCEPNCCDPKEFNERKFELETKAKIDLIEKENELRKERNIEAAKAQKQAFFFALILIAMIFCFFYLSVLISQAPLFIQSILPVILSVISAIVGFNFGKTPKQE